MIKENREEETSIGSSKIRHAFQKNAVVWRSTVEGQVWRQKDHQTNDTVLVTIMNT